MSDLEQEAPPPPLTLQTLGEAAGLFRYLWPYKLKFTLAMLSLVVGSLLGLAFPGLAGKMVDAALLQLKDGVAETWLQNINLVALGLMAVLALQAAFGFVRTLWFVEVGERSLADLRRDTYARLICLPMGFHSARRVGELTSRLSADLSRIHDTLVESVPHFLSQGILLVGGVILIALISLKLTGLMLVSVPVLMVVAVMFGKLIRRMSKQAQDRLAESNVIVEETLQNIVSVKAFTNEGFEQGRYQSALGNYIRLASFLLYTAFVAGAAGSFAHFYSQVQRALGASQRVREILKEKPEPAGVGVPITHRLRGDVIVDDIHFRYPSRPEVEVLRGASVMARSGQRIALVGPSGTGKSTLVSLLLRFYDPEQGRILIDGLNAREYDLHQLRSQMAVVPQDVILFGGTIAENIAYGRPGAPPDDIEQAARLANAHEFIVKFPEAYSTRVGERGVQLSGGQRQRIAIARAILRDPAILLLDEATSSLDSHSESLVLEALDRLMQGRTSFVIAHRLSTVRGADCIFVLDHGRVVESGTHAELMERPDGMYRNLSLLQLQPEEGAPVA
jgi:ABC-type multidrug transport system fused ATPase/permease subunit